MAYDEFIYRKEKRWAVYSRPVSITVAGSGKTYEFFDVVQGSGKVLNTPDRPAWILELETNSFEIAKQKAVELSDELGLENVRLERIVDLSAVLLPIV